MKKTKFILGMVAGAAAIALMGCDALTDVTDVVDTAAIAAAKTAAAYEGWDTSVANTITKSGSVGKITLPPFAVDSSTGLSVEFTFDGNMGSTTDWTSLILATEENIYVTIPNLDPYNTTNGDLKIKGKNAYPTITGATLYNGLAWNSAQGASHKISIEFAKEAVAYYLDDDAWILYGENVLGGNMAEFTNAFFESVSAGTCVFNQVELGMSDLSIVAGLKHGSASPYATVTELADLMSSLNTSNDAITALVNLCKDDLALLLLDDSTTAEVKATITKAFELAELAIPGNDVSGTGTANDPYVLTTIRDETLAEKTDAIDCNKYMAAAATFNEAGTISWENPLKGKTLTGFTLSADVYMTAGAQFDGILSFFKKGNTADGGFLSIFENGNIRYNSDGFFESIGNEGAGALTVAAQTWTQVTVTVATDGTITYYKDGVAVDTSAIVGYTGGVNATWESVNTFLTEFADTIGISVGTSWWKAGFVDAGNYIANIKVYSTALTAEQVAAIE